MWDLPGPGLEPMSPALAGGFLTAAPPEKPNTYVLELSLNLIIACADSHMDYLEIIVKYFKILSSLLCLLKNSF